MEQPVHAFVLLHVSVPFDPLVSSISSISTIADQRAGTYTTAPLYAQSLYIHHNKIQRRSERQFAGQNAWCSSVSPPTELFYYPTTAPHSDICHLSIPCWYHNCSHLAIICKFLVVSKILLQRCTMTTIALCR